MAGFDHRSRQRGATVQQRPRLCPIIDAATSRSPQAATQQRGEDRSRRPLTVATFAAFGSLCACRRTPLETSFHARKRRLAARAPVVHCPPRRRPRFATRYDSDVDRNRTKAPRLQRASPIGATGRLERSRAPGRARR